jgi:alpha-1,3-rhamnosyl/mannosyltransferase
VSDRTINVGVNLLWLVPGDVGGSEEYTTRLLLAAAEAAPGDVQITLFALPSLADLHPELTSAFPVVTAPTHGWSRARRIAIEATWLPSRARRHGIDVLHHAGGTIPLLRATPSIVTIHDLQPLDLGDTFSSSKQTYLRRRLPVAARRSRVVVTTSAFVRDGVIARFGIPPQRVVLAPPPVVVPPAGSGVPLDELKARYDLDGPWFTYPAITYPHKDHLTLVRAFARLHEKHPDARLVLTGRADRSEQAVADEADRLGVVGAIRRTGRIDRADLEGLVRHAAALTFPSRYEGFGLPVLEAMAVDCPVIAADATALPEVAGGAALLVPPGDEEAWTAAMVRLLRDSDERERLVAAGRARVADFDPARSGSALLDAYRRGGSKLSRRDRRRPGGSAPG